MTVGLVRKAQTAWDVLTTQGAWAVLRQALATLGTVETYVAYRVDLGNALPEPVCDVPVMVRRATETDFQAFRTMPRPFSRHAEFHDRFRLDQCYLSVVGEDVAHVAWLYYPHEQGRHPTRFRHLRRDEACIANCVTLPTFRGRGVYARTLVALLGRLRDEGYRACYMYVETDNLASHKGVAKAGFRRVGRSWRIRFFYHRDPAAGVYVQGPCRRRGAA